MDLHNSAQIEISVSEFVSLLNQTLDYSFSGIVILGELANLRVSKGKWVYFDLKDDGATVKFFGTVYQLPGPLEDGMLLKVRGTPKLHNLYGFSVTVQNIQVAGEGAIRRAAELLQAQLAAEGLFAVDRKRSLPYPPTRIGLVASAQSAAYADFVKVIAARWGGLQIEHIDVQVQGEIAPAQIVSAIQQFNSQADPADVLVVIRGGGSAEDLAAFSTEQVTRAVAASRIPTIVAIGHEIDISLAELAADMRASTPSNAAELLVPDKKAVKRQLGSDLTQLHQAGQHIIRTSRERLRQNLLELSELIDRLLQQRRQEILSKRSLLQAFSPEQTLARGYAIIRQSGTVVRSGQTLLPGMAIDIQLADATVRAAVQGVDHSPRKEG